jgi:hypothetical protein
MNMTICPLLTRGRRLVLGGLWLGSAALVGLSACGSEGVSRLPVYEVKGKVLRRDGQPLSGGHIYFVPKQGVVTSEGTIGSDGSFSLETGSWGEGAPAGEYKVRIEPADGSLTATNRRPTRAGKKLPFPEKYLDEDGSGLLVTIKAQANTLAPFRLK